VKQTGTHGINTDETMSACNTSEQTDEEATVYAGSQQVRVQAAPTRYAQRSEAQVREKQHRKYYRILFRIAFVIIIGITVTTGILKGYGILKTYGGREITIERFEKALENHDIPALKKYIRIPDPAIAVNRETLQPLFAYLDQHPEGYEKIHNELEKQTKKDPVYIKGITSEPPIFLMRVYEKQYFLFHQYVFEPAVYSLIANVEGSNVALYINGKKVHTTSSETYTGKIASLLPGVYEMTAIKKDEDQTKKQTKKIILFGGQKAQQVHFQFE
jgi:uncharacterized membrane protein YvbJ